MPRGYCIKFLSLTFSFLACSTLVRGESRPLVIGYERFHSDTPSIEGGRLLFNELGCINCHDNSTGLPERKGPRLDGILNRSRPGWVRAFLKNPAKTKPGTTMPQVNLTDREIEAVLHYLASIKPEKEIPEAFRFVNAERGIALYHEFGCAACHEPSSDFQPPEGKPNDDAFTYPHVPLPDFKQKYDFDSLSAFLYEPHDIRPMGRMPKFQLDIEDGGDIAAHLLDFQSGDSTEYPSIPDFIPNLDLVEVGRIVVEMRNCNSCHDFPDTENLAPTRPLPISNEISSYDHFEDHPQYNLSVNQKASIQQFLNSDSASEAPAISHLQALNCMACHDRDGLGGPDSARKVYFAGDHDLGDTGRYPPPLTDIGRKLQPEWLKGVLIKKDSEQSTRKRKNKQTPEHEIDYTVRPYLKVQMPEFGDSVHGLPDILFKEDHKIPKLLQTHGDPEIGRKLLGTQGGLNCITCHNWGERRSLGIRALNLSNMAQRIQPGWLHDYLIDPASYRTNTLMPSFWPGGEASNKNILRGNTQAQIAAIYAFSENEESLPEGFPDKDSTDYEIIPTDRPVIQRTFMEGIGTHAILVGFPEGIHLAFNGESGQPAMMWKGRFFDAYDTWYSRFPKFEKPLGVEIVKWPKTKKKPIAQYRGYRLDSGNVPEFIFILNGAEVYERFTPQFYEDGKIGMRRVIRYSRLSQLNDKRLNHPRNTKRTEYRDNDPMTRSFIYQW
ncbi:MAG: c-type cytochrome [Verrucomicrobia bacterium]|nr:c-type cytochrome [Verrucomicrobiota bacterium]